MIPKHCIRLFEAKYETYPSYTKLLVNMEVFKKLVNRSELIWCSHSIRDNVDNMIASLHSFHESGIYIYLDTEQQGSIYENVVYFMFEIRQKHIVDFTINQIKKMNKNGN
jgi:5S rRNA maturation endonuclease (ribonuclease M5)